MSESPSSTSAKSIPKQKVDKQLWRDIQEKTAGSESRKLDAVGLLFDRQSELPRQSTTLIRRLAGKDQSVALRRAIASKLRESQDLSLSSVLSILDVLRNDPDPQVKSTADEIYKSTTYEIYKILQPIADISRNIQATIQSIRIPQLDLSNLVVNIPQLDLSSLQKTVAATANLSARDFIDPVILSSQALESVARSAQAVLPSYYPQTDLEVIERIRPKFEKSRTIRLRSKLAACVPGKVHWKAYQDVCREILRYAFVPPLAEPIDESPARGRDQRRDLIFHISYDSKGFWGHIQMYYKSLAFIVECKNYATPLPQNQVTITAKYLSDKGLGLFGIIICRKGLSESARRTQEKLWNEGKMLLVLSDHDLQNILNLKEAGEDPSKVIDNSMRKFRQSF